MNINVSDIIEGRPSIILGLIWTIILHCHVSLVNSCSHCTDWAAMNNKKRTNTNSWWWNKDEMQYLCNGAIHLKQKKNGYPYWWPLVRSLNRSMTRTSRMCFMHVKCSMVFSAFSWRSWPTHWPLALVTRPWTRWPAWTPVPAAPSHPVRFPEGEAHPSTGASGCLPGRLCSCGSGTSAKSGFLYQYKGI